MNKKAEIPNPFDNRYVKMKNFVFKYVFGKV